MFFERLCVGCDAPNGPICALCTGAMVRLRVGPDGIRAAFLLDDRMRQVLIALKYRRERRLVGWAASALAPLVPAAADVITWVPATPERMRWRGYDQAGELARAVGARLAVPVRPLLRRAAGDRRQTGRTRAERASGPGLSARSRIPDLVALIDDVVTTGATMAAANRALTAVTECTIVPVALAATPSRTQQGRLACSSL